MKCTDEKCNFEDKNHTCFRNSKGELHCEDGPAVIYLDGSQEWYINNKLHRDDGPDIMWSDGIQDWWVNGKEIT